MSLVPDSEFHWFVGRTLTDPDKPGLYRQLADHVVTDVEAVELMRAIGALRTFARSNMLQRADLSVEALTELLTPESAGFRLTTDGHFRGRVMLAAEVALGQLVSVRRRTEIGAIRHFGTEASRRVRAVFEDAYREHASYRTVWELRNASEHGHSVIDMIRVVSELQPDGTHRSSIRLEVDRLMRAVRDASARTLRRWWEPDETADLLLELGQAHVEVRSLVEAAYRELENELGSAALLVQQHTQGLWESDGRLVLHRLRRASDGGLDLHQVEFSRQDLDEVTAGLMILRRPQP